MVTSTLVNITYVKSHDLSEGLVTTKGLKYMHLDITIFVQKKPVSNQVHSDAYLSVKFHSFVLTIPGKTLAVWLNLVIWHKHDN